MLKGKKLLNYILNYRQGDKFIELYQIADEVLGLDDIAKRAISLLDCIQQYTFLESVILEAPDSDQRLIDYMKGYGIPLPVKYAWKRLNVKGEKVDGGEWFESKSDCYFAMYDCVMYLIRHLLETSNDESYHITTNGDKITIEYENFKDEFIVYEMQDFKLWNITI